MLAADNIQKHVQKQKSSRRQESISGPVRATEKQ
jgi:hypothetical protein